MIARPQYVSEPLFAFFPCPWSSRIKPSELIGLQWMKAEKELNAPNVLALIRRFNDVRVTYNTDSHHKAH